MEFLFRTKLLQFVYILELGYNFIMTKYIISIYFLVVSSFSF